MCTSYKDNVGEKFNLEFIDQNRTFVDYILEKVMIKHIHLIHLPTVII